VENARLHLGLAALESPTEEGGCLSVHIGDAVSPEATVDGGFAGNSFLMPNAWLQDSKLY
jgi:hypothetical protein